MFHQNYKINFLHRYKYILKDIFYSSYFYYSKICYNQNIDPDYEKIIVTWATENHFKKNGSFSEKTLNINSSSLKKTLWFEEPKIILNNSQEIYISHAKFDAQL